MNSADTIYALASGHGKAGVAVFRISGAKAFAALHDLGVTTPLVPRNATLVTLKTPSSSGLSRGSVVGLDSRDKTENDGIGNVIDQALALTFPGPHSFTGEDVLELHTHGSRAVIDLLYAALASIPGLRLAEPGEFARRAFLNQKFDLLEAEGLADLIDADTPAQHAQAMRQLGGEMSDRIVALREQILTPLALLEAYIDFPDEEIPEETLTEVRERIATLSREIGQLLNDGGIGEKIRDGIEVVIFGPPNAGKSSLLNALAQRDVAIVSDEAGTTRDMIEVHLNLDGYAVTLVDTAGMRDNAAGKIEQEGIRRAQHRTEKAALKIAVLDIITAAESYSYIEPLIDMNTIVVLNKSDLISPPRHSRESGNLMPWAMRLHGNLLPEIPAFAGMTMVEISTVSSEGLEPLIAILKEKICQQMADAPSPLITRARHREAFQQAQIALIKFQPTAALELICEELRVAAQQIGKITGKITTDDLLDVVFRRFCIGK